MIQKISWIVLVLLISTPLVVSAQVGKRFKSEYPDAKGLSLDPNFSEGFGTAVSILDGEAFIGESRGGSLVSGNVTVLLRGGDGLRPARECRRLGHCSTENRNGRDRFHNIIVICSGCQSDECAG